MLGLDKCFDTYICEAIYFCTELPELMYALH